VLTGLPLDCCGADDGVWTLFELLELLELLDLSLFEELPLCDELPEDPVLDEPVLAAACVAPGSRSASTPATAAPLIPTVAVVTFSR
jgi:hypothetical protein